VVSAAVGAHPGRGDLQVENLSGQNNSLVPAEAALDRTARSAHLRPRTDVVDVEVLTLDGYVEATGIAPDFVKVDVEGFEWEVLQGAARLVSERRPAWMIELTRRRQETAAWLVDHGYEVLDENLRHLVRPTWTGQNVVFLHRDRHKWALERFAR
jgi:FkbM family methyltransferase